MGSRTLATSRTATLLLPSQRPGSPAVLPTPAGCLWFFEDKVSVFYWGFFPTNLMLLAFIHSFACFNFVVGGFACTLEDLHDQTRHAIYSSIVMPVNGLEKNG